MATQQHIVSSYDEELEHLNKTIMQMGGIAESQLDRAIQSILKRDSAMAQKVVKGDHKVDELEHEVANFTVRLLALRQPMAVDLRNIIAALKISSDIERIADYASNVAKRAIALSQFPEVNLVQTVPRMGRQVQQMFKNILDAYAQRDAEKARRVWKSDEEVDEMYTSIFRELLTYMNGRPAQHHGVHPFGVHGQESGAGGRSCDQLSPKTFISSSTANRCRKIARNSRKVTTRS